MITAQEFIKNPSMEISSEVAIDLHDSKFWSELSDRETAIIQLSQPLLVMPWTHFTESLEPALEDSVWTHEFANPAFRSALLSRLQEGLTGRPPEFNPLSIVFSDED